MVKVNLLDHDQAAAIPDVFTAQAFKDLVEYLDSVEIKVSKVKDFFEQEQQGLPRLKDRLIPILTPQPLSMARQKLHLTSPADKTLA